MQPVYIRETLDPLSRWAGCLILAMAVGAQAASPLPYRLAPIHGQIIDQTSQTPIKNAVINAAWELEPTHPGQRTELNFLYVQQAQSDQEGRFVIHVPDQPLPASGFKLRAGHDPLLTVYAAGHLNQVLENGSKTRNGQFLPFNRQGTASPQCKWDGKEISLIKFEGDPSSGTPMKELAVWQDKLKATLSASSWHGDGRAALVNQQLLSNLIRQECGKLNESQRLAICPERLAGQGKSDRSDKPDSPVQATPNADREPVITETRSPPPAGQGGGAAQR